MSILALDLGKTTGYAIWTGEATKVSGSIDFAPNRSRQFEGGGIRFLRFRNWLDTAHAATPIKEVVFEEVRRHIGTTAAHSYGGFLAHLSAWCEERNIPYAGFPVQHIKKFATGKSAAKKEEVIAAVKQKWGMDPKDDNEADAIALLHLRLYEIMN